MDIVVDIVEAQDGILYVSGYVDKSLTVGDDLSYLRIYQPAKKKKQRPKKLSESSLLLTVETLIVDGETFDTISAGTLAQIGLIGDADPILRLIADHQWHESNGRYFLPRKETRLITLARG